jgi:hypothetical protein
MSNQVNQELLERAIELLEEITNHPSRLDVALSIALEENDLEEVSRLVSLIEGELARDEFYHRNVL